MTTETRLAALRSELENKWFCPHGLIICDQCKETITEFMAKVQSSHDLLIDSLLKDIATVPFQEGRDNWWIDKDSVEQVLLDHKSKKVNDE